MSGRGLPEHRLVVGLEVHAQLRTRTKCFCACPLEGGDGPNSRTCPTCLGLPGGLPVLSERALSLAVRTAVALECTITETAWWDRKHYGYADLPKGYQLTQHAAPIGTGGRLELDAGRGPRSIRIRHVHLEEDTGRSVHTDEATLLDFDRAGTPLLEIVTAPDLRSPDEVRACLSELRRLLRWIGVSNADMEHGEMRCEPNVNVVLGKGDARVASRIAEIKNLNSISAAVQAVEHERTRQLAELRAGAPQGPLPRSTRGWDDDARRTVPQRAKEEAADYRFLPDPDLPVVTRCRAIADVERRELPELPRARRMRLVREHGVDPESADVLTASRDLADWYDSAAAAAGDAAGAVASWVVGDVLRWCADGAPPALAAEELGTLVLAVERGHVPRDAARRTVLPALAEGRAWRDVVREQALDVATDAEIVSAVHAALDARPDLVTRARAGHAGVVDVLVGDVMSRTRGRADGAHVRTLVAGFVTGVSTFTPPTSLDPDDAPPIA